MLPHVRVQSCSGQKRQTRSPRDTGYTAPRYTTACMLSRWRFGLARARPPRSATPRTRSGGGGDIARGVVLRLLLLVGLYVLPGLLSSNVCVCFVRFAIRALAAYVQRALNSSHGTQRPRAEHVHIQPNNRPVHVNPYQRDMSPSRCTVREAANPTRQYIPPSISGRTA